MSVEVAETGTSPVATTIPMRLETRLLIDRLAKGKPRDIITDEELKTVCGKDCRPGREAYTYLDRAIKHVLTNFQVKWKRIFGAGYIQCLTASEIVGVVQHEMVSIHRRAKRSVKTLKIVDTTQLDDLQKSSHRAMVAQYATMAMFTRPQTTKAIAARPESKPIDLNRMLEMMRK